MSFLDTNYKGFTIATRLTQKGRESIANGNFVISHFAVGDSEYTYTGSTTNQKVLSPFDDYGNVKYPLSYVDGGTSYGIPVSLREVVECSNVMGPAGFVSGSFGDDFVIKSSFETVTGFTGNTDTINVSDGTDYPIDSFITLALNADGLDGDTITGYSSSLIYKIVSTGSTSITIDRNVPTLPNGDVVVIQNDAEFENPVPTGTTEQHNPWTLNVVWDTKPIGLGNSDRDLTGYTSNIYVGTKEFLGYNTSEGQTSNTGTTIANTLGELITITPEEQKCIAIIHYSKNGDDVDPNRFFKYDDHISASTGYTGPNPVDLSDEEYFQVHIPFLMYHRNTGTTVGASFHMSTVDKEIISSYNSNFVLKYRDLLDEQNFRVGKIFYNQQIIVFDDEEIVAALDYKSNRRYTLPAPKISSIITYDPLSELTSGKTMWITYMLSYSGDDSLNGLPCNYFSKITGSTTPQSVSVKFADNDFQFLNSTTGGTINGYIADELHILFQITNNNELPESDSWLRYPHAIALNGSGLIDSSLLDNHNVTINESDYLDAVDLGQFYLGEFMADDFTTTSGPYFGDEQVFPGSVSVVRGTEIETLTFRANLPSDKFTTSVNPTYTSGNPMITEVALLNSNKETLIMAKMSEPLERSGDQTIDVQLDF